ncbi:hypothetical protein GCM10027347_39810 [Larkinella harenae]
MFKQFIDKIPGADLYMVTSFLTFLIFFVLVGIYLLIVDKKHIQRISQLPLDDQTA